MFISNDRKGRVAIFAVITVLSLFLLGAGAGVAGSDEKQAERQQMTELVSAMSVQFPEQYREEWQKAAEKNPQLLLSISADKLAYDLDK
jgi:hypothetical protein